MTAIKLVLFDITGTILRDTGSMVRSLTTALQKNNIPMDEKELREWRGAEKAEVIRHFVARHLGRPAAAGDPVVERVYQDFRTLLEAEFAGHNLVPIPGAEATFNCLRERGILLGTTTGYHRRLSDILLKRLGWYEMFRTTVASDEVARGRPAPYMIFHAMEAAQVANVAEVVTVGDTPLDLLAGTNAGVRGVVGVLTGAHTAERLKQERHTHLLPSVAELPEAIRELEAGS
jgi:phosphonatase-like hydrolase